MGERSDAERLLNGLENGTVSSTEAALVAGNIDPVLFYNVVRFLREVYPASDPAATAVLGRVVELTSKEATLIRRFKEGEQDPISTWFASEYSYREFRGRGHEMIARLIDKLES